MLVFIFSCCNTILAQTKKDITILEIETLRPLSYTTVYIYNSKVIAYTDSNGRFTFNSINEDSIAFIHTGYLKRVVCFKDLKDTVFLTRRTNVIPEISIKTSMKLMDFGNFEYKKNNTFHHWVSSEFIRKIEIPQDIDYYTIQSVFLPFEINKNYKDSCACKIHLYKYNNELEDILTDPIILNYNTIPKDYIINIQNQKVYSNEKMLYLGLECFLKIPFEIKNKHVNYNFVENKQFLKHMKTSPITIFFDSKSSRDDLSNNLCFVRNKEDWFEKRSNKNWRPVIFTGGITIKAFSNK